VEYTEIGYTLKPHGLAGEIKIFVQEQWEDAIDDLDVVYLEIKGKKVPYFLDAVRGGGAMIASFEDIDSRDDALMISSKPLFAKSSDLPAPLHVETVDIPDFVGYTMVDKSTGAILGVINGVVEYPHQIMAILHHNGNDVLIPLVEQFVMGQDDARKVLEVDLPEGLLELEG
jgi:16S rRNA processing protein RimM